MEPIISVVVPIYNAEKYLERCLDSLKNQTIREIEVLMINDGSPDRSGEICRFYSDADPRFVYIQQENAGVSAARNAGLDRARGQYVGFCDSDDWVEPDLYEDLYTLVKENGADVAVVSFTGSDEPVDRTEDEDTVHSFTGREALREMHLGRLFRGHLCNKIIKREIIGEFRLDPTVTIFEDMLFLWEIFAKSEKVVFQNICRYHYVFNPDSALRGEFRESYRSVQTACDQMLLRTEELYPDDAIYAQKTLLWGNYALGEKLASAGKLTKAEYKPLRASFRRFYSSEVRALFGAYLNKIFGIFLLGRIPYLCYFKLRKLYRRIRWGKDSV